MYLSPPLCHLAVAVGSLGSTEWPKQPLQTDDLGAFAPPAGIYSSILPASACILELCASRYSHLPDGFVPRLVIGQGMNSSELAANPSLHQHFVQVRVYLCAIRLALGVSAVQEQYVGLALALPARAACWDQLVRASSVARL
jgi:hypothetical protein